MLYAFEDGNWSCDCNRVLDVARAYQQPEPEHTGNCLGGPTLRIRRFEILNPQLDVVYMVEPFETERADD
jgi:hypothetical protein